MSECARGGKTESSISTRRPGNLEGSRTHGPFECLYNHSLSKGWGVQGAPLMFPSRVVQGGSSRKDTRVCQRCERPGHAIYECKNPRPYKARPTRAQLLMNPSLGLSRPPQKTQEPVRRYVNLYLTTDMV